MAEDLIDSLWGEEFVIPQKRKEKVKKIVEKISKPKEVKAPIEKKVKSKTLPLKDKLEIITNEVYRVLGKQKDNILVMADRDTFHNYISRAIQNNRIAVDTETNNSLDPITCKLMGLCLYTPGEKQAYVPINHRNPETKERLSWQLTEKDVQEELQRIIDAHTFDIMHNGKFDYQVIKCTCGGIELFIDWDTMIGAKLLDENERSAGLKEQYIDKIDPEQEKYSIDHLFAGVEYADVDPYVFAFYASHDSRMTDALQEWQANKFKDPDLARVLNLFHTIEMPLVQVVAEMELNGVEFDKEYDERLSKKYHKKLDELDKVIAKELENLKPQIEAWRLTKEANFKPTLGRTKTVGGIKYSYNAASGGPGDPGYWYESASGKQLDLTEALALGLTATEQKSKNEQLEDPINLGSPTQLAILFYDILKVGVIDKKSPRGTGESVLEKINLPIAKLLLERRGLVKLIDAFIDSLPDWVNSKDGRIHCHFHPFGAATGRFSSSEPNLQQIPSHSKELRLLFRARTDYNEIDCSDDMVECSSASDIMSNGKYVRVKDLQPGDIIDVDNEDGTVEQFKIKEIKIDDIKCKIYLCEEVM